MHGSGPFANAKRGSPTKLRSAQLKAWQTARNDSVACAAATSTKRAPQPSSRAAMLSSPKASLQGHNVAGKTPSPAKLRTAHSQASQPRVNSGARAAGGIAAGALSGLQKCGKARTPGVLTQLSSAVCRTTHNDNVAGGTNLAQSTPPAASSTSGELFVHAVTSDENDAAAMHTVSPMARSNNVVEELTSTVRCARRAHHSIAGTDEPLRNSAGAALPQMATSADEAAAHTAGTNAAAVEPMDHEHLVPAGFAPLHEMRDLQLTADRQRDLITELRAQLTAQHRQAAATEEELRARLGKLEDENEEIRDNERALLTELSNAEAKASGYEQQTAQEAAERIEELQKELEDQKKANAHQSATHAIMQMGFKVLATQLTQALDEVAKLHDMAVLRTAADVGGQLDHIEVCAKRSVHQ